MKPKSKILIIAGSDSSGGAGIQADIKTITALGSYAMTAITAITSQNTLGVEGVQPVSIGLIEKQIILPVTILNQMQLRLECYSSKVIRTVIKILKNSN